MLDRLARDSSASKGLKQQAHRLLHLEVWIEHDLSVDIVNEAGSHSGAPEQQPLATKSSSQPDAQPPLTPNC